MGECRTLRCQSLGDVQAHARIALAAVPVAPVALHLAQGSGNLIGCGLDFLQADHIRALTFDPFLDLCVTRPDAVDVPGGEFQKRAWAA